MVLDVEIRSPEMSASASKGLSAAFVPYGSFYVYLRVGFSPNPQFPLKVKISEEPDKVAGFPPFTVGDGRILKLDNRSSIGHPCVLFWSYEVASLRSFDLKGSAIKFLVQMNTDNAALEAFKGSTMTLVVTDENSFQESKEIKIRNANPNNHFHWRDESVFVDGAYFKCVHVDADAKIATPFFFLYGINNPKLDAPNSEAFVMFGKGGSVALDASLHPDSTAVPTSPEPHYLRFSSAAYEGEKLYGLDIMVGENFVAADTRFAGKALVDDEEVSWDLYLTKIHIGCRTDWNPLAPFQSIPLMGEEAPPGMPLMKHTVSLKGTNAYYMSHNMNSFVYGTINWKGMVYEFDSIKGLKGYQDSNWGSGGFPHPYIWMQANNFFMADTGLPSPTTSLVAMFTPGMAYVKLVAGICLRHDGGIYRISTKPWWLDVIIPINQYLADHVLGDIQCTVDFEQKNVSGIVERKSVDMSSIADRDAKIGTFPRPKEPVDQEAYPVKFILQGRNDDNDEIEIIAECDSSTVMLLPAPLDGKMVDDVTKESLLVRFTIKLRPKGGAEIVMTSGIGTAEYGD